MTAALELLLNGTVIPTYEIVVEKSEKRALDRAKVVVKKNQAVALGDDVKVREKGTTTYLFGGKVVELDEYYDSKEALALSYAKSLEERRIIPPKYYLNQRPEQIVADLIATYTSMTFASTTFNSGVTIARYRAAGSVGEVVREMALIANADFWSEVDSTGAAKFYFERASARNLGVSIVTGGTSANARRLDYNSGEQEIVNAAEVYGRVKHWTETLAWTKSSDSTAVPPWLILVPVEAVTLAARIGGVSLTEPSEFEYTPGDRNYITFKIPWPAGELLEIDYTMDNTVVGYAENSSSIATWGRRHKVFSSDIDSSAAVQELANKLVTIYGSPRKSLKVRLAGIRTNIKDGGYVTVTDPYLGITNQTFIVRKVTWKYPEGTTELELGEFIPELYELERALPKIVEQASRKYVSITSKKRMLKLYFGSSNYLGETNTQTADNLTVNIGGPYSWVEFSIDAKITKTDLTTVYYDNIAIYKFPYTDGVRRRVFASVVAGGESVKNPQKIEVKLYYREPLFSSRTQFGTDIYTYNFESTVKTFYFGWPRCVWSFEASYNSSTGDVIYYRGAGRNTYITGFAVEYV
jgi:hypothetical protein